MLYLYIHLNIFNYLTMKVSGRSIKSRLEIKPSFKYFLLLSLSFFVGINAVCGSQQKIDSLIKVIKTTKVDTVKIKSLYYISDAYCDSAPRKSFKYAQQSLELSKLIDYKQGMSFSFNAIGRAYYNLGNFDSARICFEKRKELTSSLGDSLGLAGAYDNIGIIYIHSGEYDKALELRKKAIDIYKDHNKKSLVASGYTWIGSIYKSQSKFPEALEYYLEALKIYEDEKDSVTIGFPLLDISSIYRQTNQYELAKQYSHKATKAFQKANNKLAEGVCLYRLSLIYHSEENYKKAIELLLEAKSIFEKINNNYFLNLTKAQLGSSYRYMGDFENAMIFFKEATPYFEQAGDKNLLASLIQNTGTVYLARKEYMKALEFMKRSDELYKELENVISMKAISVNFINIYAHLNMPDSAMKYTERYMELSDSIYNKQNSEAIAEMQTKYETEKKEKEILTLSIENEKEKRKRNLYALSFGIFVLFVILLFLYLNNKKKKNDAILKLQISENDMKALRSQLNPHFMFNCLHSIQSLVNKNQTEIANKYIEDFASLTRLILENSPKSEILLSQEIDILTLFMELEKLSFQKPFEYSVDINSEINPNITYIPPLILQPFAENSIKHGFQNLNITGEIKIIVDKTPTNLIVNIEDNGTGRKLNPEQSLLKPEKNSMGLNIIRERLELISKTKDIKSSFLIEDIVDTTGKPIGTRVKIILPFELAE